MRILKPPGSASLEKFILTSIFSLFVTNFNVSACSSILKIYLYYHYCIVLFREKHKYEFIYSVQGIGQVKSVLMNNLSLSEVYKMLQSDSIAEVTTKSSIPWHVCKNSNFVIDVSSLSNKNDITVDAWRWRSNKVYVASSDGPTEGFQKGNRDKEMRAVKRFVMH